MQCYSRWQRELLYREYLLLCKKILRSEFKAVKCQTRGVLFRRLSMSMIVQKILEKTKRHGRKTSKPAGSHAICGNPQTLTPSCFTAEDDEVQAVVPGSCPRRSRFIFSHNIYGLDRNIITIKKREMKGY